MNKMAMAIGIIYLWFGGLKLFPNYSPAEGLAKSTLLKMTFGLIPIEWTYLLLALMEITIGLFLLLNIFKKITYWVGLTHITLTFLPLLFFPSQVFGDAPLQLTLLGQYIAKNIVIVTALLLLIKENKMKIKRPG
jgi:uncharacterized membrane protein YkgB